MVYRGTFLGGVGGPQKGGKDAFPVVVLCWMLQSEPTQNIEDLLINTQIKEDLNILINELPKNQLEVLHMRLYQDMSFKEIAERTNVSINTSLGRMRYGLINLRKLIDERNLTMTQ